MYIRVAVLLSTNNGLSERWYRAQNGRYHSAEWQVPFARQRNICHCLIGREIAGLCSCQRTVWRSLVLWLTHAGLHARARALRKLSSASKHSVPPVVVYACAQASLIKMPQPYAPAQACVRPLEVHGRVSRTRGGSGATSDGVAGVMVSKEGFPKLSVVPKTVKE